MPVIILKLGVSVLNDLICLFGIFFLHVEEVGPCCAVMWMVAWFLYFFYPWNDFGHYEFSDVPYSFSTISVVILKHWANQ